MKSVERILNVALVLSAVAIAGSLVHREVKRANLKEVAAPSPVFRGNWREFLGSGRLVSGSKASPVQIVEFLDLECPACSEFQAKTLSAVEHAYRESVAVTIIHHPLRIHRFAQLAARASECAAHEDQFAPFVELALAKQDSFGIKPWEELAEEAGVADMKAFEKCLSAPMPKLVKTGQALAENLEITATPSIIVNGWQYSRPPSEKLLREDIDDILAGKPRVFDTAPPVNAHVGADKE